jgi:hypothetical protein
MVTLLVRAHTRRLGILLALLLLEMVLVSALQYLPLCGRTAMFALPVTVFLIAVGVDILPKTMPGRTLVHQSLALFAVMMAVWWPFPAKYFDIDESYAVKEMVTLADKNAAVLIYPWSACEVAYNSGWSYRIKGIFDVRFERPNTIVLSPDQHLLADAIARLVADNQATSVFYVATRQTQELPEAQIFAELERHGFRGKLLMRSQIGPGPPLPGPTSPHRVVLYAFSRRRVAAGERASS